MTAPSVPAGLAAQLRGRRARGGPDGAAWLRALPALAQHRLAAWELVPDGAPLTGTSSLVLPVRTSAGEAAALKLAWPHPENAHEHLALRLWAGRGAVRLLRAEPAERALLLERARPQDLGTLPVLQACRVLGELVRTLSLPPRPPFPRLSDTARQWRRELEEAAWLDGRFPRRFRLQAVSALQRFLREDLDLVLVHQDLHYGNVLAADRAPWLAIDPQPVLGTPEFAMAPALWNRVEEAGHGGALAAALTDRIEAMALAADADEDRARAWALVRFTMHAKREAEEPTGTPHHDVSRLVQLCKAVQRGA